MNYHPFPLMSTPLWQAWAFFEKGFGVHEQGIYKPYALIDEVVKVCEKFSKQIGQIGSGEQGEELRIRRSCKVAWVSYTPETAWIYNELVAICARVNQDYFRYDLTAFQTLQYTVYEGSAEDAQHYDWHIDAMGPNLSPQRKLSMTIQLSDPMDYEGGDLIIDGGVPHVAKKEKGLLYAFPSYVKHRVSPVTRGIRRSLVAWAVGPQFR